MSKDFEEFRKRVLEEIFDVVRRNVMHRTEMLETVENGKPITVIIGNSEDGKEIVVKIEIADYKLWKNPSHDVVLLVLEKLYFKRLKNNPMLFYQSLDELLPELNKELRKMGYRELELKELEEIVDKLHKKYWLAGFYRHPKTPGFPILIEFTRRIKTKPTKPNWTLVLNLLEQEYLKVVGTYGRPAFIGGKHVWSKEGLYERVNKQLTKLGFLKISWEEWRTILESFKRPEYHGIVYVSWIIAPNMRVEPNTIAIYKPLRFS